MRAITMVAGVTLSLAFLGTLAGCDSLASPSTTSAQDGPAPSSSASATFVRVVDGDTIAVKPTGSLADTGHGEHSVRLLGIDAPEMHKMGDQAPDCGAEAATDHLEELLSGAGTVTLVFDSVSDHTDRFGRSLAYVELDGHDLNLEQAAGGFAEAWYPHSEPVPTRYLSYRAAEQEAQESGAGSFDSCPALGRQ